MSGLSGGDDLELPGFRREAADDSSDALVMRLRYLWTHYLAMDEDSRLKERCEDEIGLILERLEGRSDLPQNLYSMDEIEAQGPGAAGPAAEPRRSRPYAFAAPQAPNAERRAGPAVGPRQPRPYASAAQQAPDSERRAGPSLFSGYSPFSLPSSTLPDFRKTERELAEWRNREEESNAIWRRFEEFKEADLRRLRDSSQSSSDRRQE